MSTSKSFLKESDFQKHLIQRVRERFPDSLILKNDSRYLQGIPDLLILNGNKWAMLECKINRNASHQPNQDYYIKKCHGMSYARFVYPENYEEVLNELERAL